MLLKKYKFEILLKHLRKPYRADFSWTVKFPCLPCLFQFWVHIDTDHLQTAFFQPFLLFKSLRINQFLQFTFLHHFGITTSLLHFNEKSPGFRSQLSGNVFHIVTAVGTVLKYIDYAFVGKNDLLFERYFCRK